MIDVNMRECIFESMLMGFACDCGGLFYKGPIKRRNCCGGPIMKKLVPLNLLE